MAYTDIDKPTDYFNTKLWTGNTTERTISTDFSPDWVWIKNRSTTEGHRLHDIVRGANKMLRTQGTNAEANTSQDVMSFDTNGFTIGTETAVNGNGNSLVGWSWKAGGTAVSNTDGSITSSVSANQDAGFSIVKWTGTTSNGTIGHGLGTTPSLFISKSMAGAHAWGVYHKSIGIGSTTLLNSSGASDADATYYGGTSPTSTTMGLGTANATNASGDMIGYAFAEKQGFSKFGSYTGNGNADGTFVYTGFKPAFVMVKRTTGTENWYMKDNKRDPYNPVFQSTLMANLSRNEYVDWTGTTIDYLSNGF